MNIFQCPCCGGRAVSWDPRCNSFLCLMKTCNAWYTHPPVQDREVESELILSITWGQIDVKRVQDWLDSHQNDKKCSYCTRRIAIPDATIALERGSSIESSSGLV